MTDEQQRQLQGMMSDLEASLVTAKGQYTVNVPIVPEHSAEVIAEFITRCRSRGMEVHDRGARLTIIPPGVKRQA